MIANPGIQLVRAIHPRRPVSRIVKFIIDENLHILIKIVETLALHKREFEFVCQQLFESVGYN